MIQKCTKRDCPFTHMSGRIPALSPNPAIATPENGISLLSLKHCRCNTQCTRPDYTLDHPTITVPPQHALKWIRPHT
ncbi:hypothetical protein GH733_013230, partial [Mirounga leonina]